jgi:hypothetical protein
MTGRHAVLQLRIVSVVLRHERMRGRRPEGLRERASLLIEQAAADLDGTADGPAALAEAREELARFMPTQRRSG